MWGADWADMQLIHKYNKKNWFLLLLTFLVKMQGLFLWKKKKGTTITYAFQKILDKSGHKTKYG